MSLLSTAAVVAVVSVPASLMIDGANRSIQKNRWRLYFGESFAEILLAIVTLGGCELWHAKPVVVASILSVLIMIPKVWCLARGSNNDSPDDYEGSGLAAEIRLLVGYFVVLAFLAFEVILPYVVLTDFLSKGPIGWYN